MSDFIQEFLDYTAAYESPTEYFYWSAVAGIAAVLRDSCYLLLGDTRIYPNMYILIIGKPAIRKAKPLNSIIELVKYVDNTKIIEGRTSIQAVIQRLSEIEKRKGGYAISGASGIIYSEEVSAMFTEDEANIPVLTDIYDWKSSYTSSLVSRGTTRLSNVVVTLLGASNEELLKPVFNNKAIYGGLLSRCLVVYADRVRHRNSLMWEDPKKYDPSSLKDRIRRMSAIKGQFIMSDEAKIFYDKWYNEVCPQLEKSGASTGAEGRIHTTVLKLAMILAISRGRGLKIDEDLIEAAIEKCQSLFGNYRRLTLGSGKSKEAEPSIILLKLLWEAQEHKLSRRDVIYKSWGDISSETLNQVVTTLLEGGLVQITEDKGHMQYYSLTERSIAFFQQKITP